jgi:hypothetical protein
MFLEGDYKKAYPTAKLFATDAAIKRHGDPNLHFDGGKSIVLKSFFVCYLYSLGKGSAKHEIRL